MRRKQATNPRQHRSTQDQEHAMKPIKLGASMTTQPVRARTGDPISAMVPPLWRRDEQQHQTRAQKDRDRSTLRGTFSRSATASVGPRSNSVQWSSMTATDRWRSPVDRSSCCRHNPTPRVFPRTTSDAAVGVGVRGATNAFCVVQITLTQTNCSVRRHRFRRAYSRPHTRW